MPPPHGLQFGVRIDRQDVLGDGQQGRAHARAIRGIEARIRVAGIQAQYQRLAQPTQRLPARGQLALDQGGQ
ncbi:hypothetical protein [Metallibacterium scheffleri]